MLGSLKRFHIVERSESISKYLDQVDHFGMSNYGDAYFIGEGKHRLCISKFMSYPIKEIEVYEAELNNELVDSMNWFKARGFNPIKFANSTWEIETQTKHVIKIDYQQLERFQCYFEDFKLETKWYDQLFESSFILDREFSVRSKNDFKSKAFMSLIQLIKNT